MDLTQKNQFAPRLLIGVGILFLLAQVFNISVGNLLWPFFVMLPAVPFLIGAFSGGKKSAGLIFPGLIIGGTGMILFMQNLANYYESWAYIWTLYPVLVGLGLIFVGERTGKEGEIRTGRGMVRYGLMALAGLALFFELFIFGNLLSGMSGVLLPVALIGAGYMMLKKQAPAGEKAKHSPRLVDIEAPPKRKNGPSPVIDPDLQRRIDEALAENDTPAAHA